ncbi:MAG: hypothetical protein AAF484_06395 [Pseudomonadota bacterium]
MSVTETPLLDASHSVSLRATSHGLVAGETRGRFRREALTEIVLRAAGILMIAGSVLLWFLTPVSAADPRPAEYGTIAAIMAATGLGIFAFGSRGFRRQMTLDIDRGKLSLTKININDQVRVNHEIELGRIESVFLRRPAQPGGLATLLVRIAGAYSPAIALTGDTEEVERVHRELAHVIQLAKQGRTRPKPNLRLSEAKRPRPTLFRS